MRKLKEWGFILAALGLHAAALCVYGWGLLAAVNAVGERPIKIDVKVLPDGHRQPELFIVPEK